MSTLLVIDDDEDDRLLIERAFHATTHHSRLYLTHNGQHALTLLANLQPLPDLVLLDLNMPGLNGFEVLSSIRCSMHYGYLPVVILTTSTAEADCQRAKQLGATDFLSKPPSYDALLAMMSQLLGTL